MFLILRGRRTVPAKRVSGRKRYRHRPPHPLNRVRIAKNFRIRFPCRTRRVMGGIREEGDSGLPGLTLSIYFSSYWSPSSSANVFAILSRPRYSTESPPGATYNNVSSTRETIEVERFDSSLRETLDSYSRHVFFPFVFIWKCTI